MNPFHIHDYRPKNVLRGENLLGDVTYAIAFYCLTCNKRKLDKGWSREAAEQHLAWLKEQGDQDA